MAMTGYIDVVRASTFNTADWVTSVGVVNPDWIWLANANVHVAASRGWFKTYTAFKSKVKTSPRRNSSSFRDVVGIGTVEISVQRDPKLTGRGSQSVLVFEDVLHVPGFVCNVLGSPLAHRDSDYVISISAPISKPNLRIMDLNNQKLAYFEEKTNLDVLKLGHIPNGIRLSPSKLRDDVGYHIELAWDESEKRRWMRLKNAPYTAEEKAYLKKGWRDEFHFLQLYQLSIYDEDDREEGRAILRAFKEQDDWDAVAQEEEKLLTNTDVGADHDFTPGEINALRILRTLHDDLLSQIVRRRRS
ncbi:uncharacterized protein AB675_4748 [Cyphellophora attinorum]|uniref:Retrovirus-related Pol polyprotein from transposon TNT 1-94-like beta-barrel domain-containing protein n=1 Tax=Cyphellophora attinorum TaxID=1664694 RepID=A0A0N1NYG2_9EURO|nr:uncharacterized protein AB675_4748 [Phialophora attinorum]KPI35654.1 hypothetical protein AB675_4748 [Phialophora attinorum]